MSMLKSITLAALFAGAALPAWAEAPRALICKLHEICSPEGCHEPDSEAKVELRIDVAEDLKARLGIDGHGHPLDNVKPAPVWRWRGTDAEGKIHVFAWREDGGQATYLKINVDTVEVKASGDCLEE